MENWFEISQLFANLAGGRLIPGFPLDSYLDLSFSYAFEPVNAESESEDSCF
jgi:hypothetical protein